MKAFKKGPLAGVEITDEAFAWARQRYYKLMNWHPDSGVPTESCLQNLGLAELLAPPAVGN